MCQHFALGPFLPRIKLTIVQWWTQEYLEVQKHSHFLQNCVNAIFELKHNTINIQTFSQTIFFAKMMLKNILTENTISFSILFSLLWFVLVHSILKAHKYAVTQKATTCSSMRKACFFLGFEIYFVLTFSMLAQTPTPLPQSYFALLSPTAKT